MKRIDEKVVPIGKLKNYPGNNYRPNQAAIDALAEDIKKNGLKVPLTVVAIKENPGYFWVISGNLRLSACLLAQLKEVRVIEMEYASDEERMEDLLSYNISRIKCEYDKAWEFSVKRYILDRKAGQRSDLSKGEKGKTNDIIAREYPENISGDTVGHYFEVWDKRRDLFDLMDKGVLKISAAVNLINFIEVNGAKGCIQESISDPTFENIADDLLRTFEGENYVCVNEREGDTDEISEAVIKKYAKKLSGLKKKAPKETPQAEVTTRVNSPLVKANKNESPVTVATNASFSNEEISEVDTSVKTIIPMDAPSYNNEWEYGRRNKLTGNFELLTSKQLLQILEAKVSNKTLTPLQMD